MTTHIIRRLIQASIVVLLVTIMVFIGMRLLPGNPLLMLIDRNQITQLSEEQLNAIRHSAGLDKPMVVQYIDWMGGIFHGDLGRSILSRTSVSQDIIKRLPEDLKHAGTGLTGVPGNGENSQAEDRHDELPGAQPEVVKRGSISEYREPSELKSEYID